MNDINNVRSATIAVRKAAKLLRFIIDLITGSFKQFHQMLLKNIRI